MEFLLLDIRLSLHGVSQAPHLEHSKLLRQYIVNTFPTHLIKFNTTLGTSTWSTPHKQHEEAPCLLSGGLTHSSPHLLSRWAAICPQTP